MNPYYTCGNLGHWMADCPQNKSSKPSESDKQNDATDKMNESSIKNKNNKRRSMCNSAM